MMEIFLYILVGAVALYALLQWGRIAYYSRVSDRLTRETRTVGRSPEEEIRSVLIVGDSLWAGVGALDSADSLAGRLAADLPGALIVNQAESGARIADGFNQLEVAVEKHGHFDQVIVQLGANDIVGLSNLTAAEEELQRLLARAQVVGTDVAYLVSGSVGFAPIFLQPLDWFYTYQTRRYIEEFSAAAKETKTLFIDLFRERKNDPFTADPNRFYSVDKFHPSGAGYGLWYEICRDNLQCFQYDEM